MDIIAQDAAAQAAQLAAGLNAGQQAQLAAVIAKITQPRLVMLPVQRGEDVISVSGSSNASLTYLALDNEDGSAAGIAINSVASTTYAGDVAIRRSINGNVIGLRIGLYGGYNNGCPFGVSVDGQPIEVPWAAEVVPESQNLRGPALAFGHARNIILGTNFGPGPHDVLIAVPNDAAVTRTMLLHGYLADANAGYVPQPRGISFYNGSGANSQFTLATANADTIIPPGGVALKSMLGFYYRNTNPAGGASILMTLTSNLGQALPFATITIAAGASGWFPLPGPLCGTMLVRCDTANALLLTLVGQN
jgi:hypothetical protein